MGRGLILLLVASLGLNIFAGGFYAGRFLAGDKLTANGQSVVQSERGERHKGKRGGGFDDPFRLMRYADALAPEQREKFRNEFRAQLPAMREGHRETRGLRRELSALMAADEWDGAAVGAKLGEISAAQRLQREKFNAAFMEAFGVLPAADRRLLLEEARKRRGERGRGHHRKGGEKGRRQGPRGEPGHEPPPPQDGDQF